MPPRRSPASITITEVARRAGVSIATVSRHINGSGPVSEEVARKIDQIRAELNYTPNTAAQQLASNRTFVIGLALNAIHSEFFGPLLFGIETRSREAGFNLLVAVNRPDAQPRPFMPIGPHNADGLIVYVDSVSENDLEKLSRTDFPIVLIHCSSPDGLEIPSVTIENKKATTELISHLIEVHGRTRILFMCGPDTQEDSRWRADGYKKALESHGIGVDPELFIFGGFERDIAYHSLKQYVNTKGAHSFDAVFTGDDAAALGVLQALGEWGLSVPEDISVAGFDDSLIASLVSPPLTTVRAPTYQVGSIAVQKLIDLIEGREVEPITLLPTEIILRRSCGCETN
jgi:DNA-binding LacI/PurR family transcriptional regulator